MKILQAILGIMIGGGCFYFFEPLAGALALCLIWVFSVIVVYQKTKVDNLKKYAAFIDSLFVVSNHPADNRGVMIADFQKWIVNVQYEKVISQCKKEEYYLDLSGNEFFSVDTPQDQRIKVIPIIFQDGENICESWEEFTGRVRLIIVTERKKHHTKLKKSNPEWYMKFGNAQEGVFEWSKE